jgi:DNA polymerase I-like protein with 3'-5' exonuclease and polymerase domains
MRNNINIYEQSFEQKQGFLKHSKTISTENSSKNFKYLNQNCHHRNKTTVEKSLNKMQEQSKILNASEGNLYLKSRAPKSKIKKKIKKVEKIIKELEQNGIKVDIRDSDIFDEELIKNLMDIKNLVSLKNKNFEGENLEIIKVGKEIILQVGT